MTTEKEFTPFEPTIRHKEIDLIQSVITRMADNQFKVKGFCVTVSGFFIALFSKDTQLILPAILASLISIYGCYKLDFNFLRTEKLYRMWFDFLMNKRSETKAWLFEMNPREIKIILKSQNPIQNSYNPDLIENETQKSWSFSFYMTLIGIVTIIFIYSPVLLPLLSKLQHYL